MGAVWSEQRKLDDWLEVELAVVDALADAARCRRTTRAAIRERAAFTVEAVKEREKVTDHDVAAFVDVVAASVGEAGRWVHYGLTSSDVLDTALGLQLAQAGEILVAGARAYRDALVARAREHVDTICVGRTHGIHAEPTTFGVKLAGFAFEAERNLRRLERRGRAGSVGALSGAVGTYAANGPEVEAAVLEPARPRARGRLDAGGPARPPRAAPQRDRAGGRRARALRHRDPPPPAHGGARGRGAVRAGQKGSSAMPHKRNPIATERICGIARLLRGYAQAGLENVALWHERDISHSSVERVALPDAYDPARLRAAPRVAVVEGMTVHADRMRANLEATQRRALLAARAARAGRDGHVARRRLPDRAGERPARVGHGHAVPRAARRGAPGLDLDAIFDPKAFTTHAKKLVAQLDQLE